MNFGEWYSTVVLDDQAFEPDMIKCWNAAVEACAQEIEGTDWGMDYSPVEVSRDISQYLREWMKVAE